MANRDLTGDTLRKVEMPPGRQEQGMEPRQAGGHQAVGGSARAPRLQSLGHQLCRLPLERVSGPTDPRIPSPGRKENDFFFHTVSVKSFTSKQKE